MLSKINKNSVLAKNFAHLSSIQALNIAIPLITYPYYFKTIGIENYGLVVVYQTTVVFIATLLNLGFNTSAVKEYSEVANIKGAINKLYWHIIYIKIAILLACLVVSYSYLEYTDKPTVLFTFSLVLLLNEFLFPIWYFQASENLSIANKYSLVGKVFYLISMFILVQEPSDYIYVPIAIGIGYLITGVLSSRWLMEQGISIVNIELEYIVHLFKSSVLYFFVSIVNIIKNRSDVFLVSYYIGNEMVAIYDLALRLLSVTQIPISIVSRSVFATMTRSKDKLRLVKVVKISLIFSLLVYLFSIVILPLAVNYFSDSNKNQDIIEVAQILLLSLPFFSISLPLAQNGLVVFGKNSKLLVGTFSTIFVYVLGVFSIIAFEVSGHLNSYAVLSLILYIYEMLYRIYACKKEGII